MKYQISEISKITNVSIDTLRYYEKLGLIRPSRDEKNRRIYCDVDVEWIKFILRLKKTNMPLKNIEKYSDLRNRGDETIKERISMLELQMEELKNKKNEIEESMEVLLSKIDIYKSKL